MTPRSHLSEVAAVLVLLACRGTLTADVVTTGQVPGTAPTNAAFITDLRAWAAPSAGNLDFSMTILGYGVLTEPVVTSELNQDNRLGLPHYQAATAFRPNLALHIGTLDLLVKPRYDSTVQFWEEGQRSGESDMNNSLYVNEWLARLNVLPDLFVSYGRENLQWGPSYLLSPSNPFNSDNGKSNPFNEVPGADFAKLVWVPNFTWTVSLIANTDDGRKGVPWSADKAYAAGVAGANQGLLTAQQQIDSAVADITDTAQDERDAALAAIDARYAAAVAAIESRPVHLPRAGETVNNILLREAAAVRNVAIRKVQATYESALQQIDAGEAAAQDQAQTQYTQAVEEFDANTRDLRVFRKSYAVKVDCILNRKYASLIFSQRETEDPRVGYYGKWDVSEATVLYTEGSVAHGFESDWLGGVSYTLNNGVTLGAEYFYNSSGNADDPIQDIIPPFRELDPQEILLRRHYVLFQAMKTDIFDRMDLTLRCAFNLDDGSDQFIGQARYGVNDYTDLFMVMAATTGDGESEYGSLVQYSVMTGVKISL